MTAETTLARRPATARAARSAVAVLAAAGVAALFGWAPLPAVAETDVPESGITVAVSAASPTLTPGSDLALTVTLTNGGSSQIPAGSVSVVLDQDRITDRGDLDALFTLKDPESVAGPTLALEAPRLLPGSSTTLAGTIPAASIGLDGTAWGVHGLVADYTADGTDVGLGTGSVTWYSGEALAPASVAVAMSLTAPAAATGLLSADDLTSLTRPGGLLTRQLEGIQGSQVALGIDPMIIASIRALGTSAPDSATEWLSALEQVGTETFPLGWADSDPAVQAEAGLPALLAPTSLAYALDPANFTATPTPTITSTPTPSPTPTPTAPTTPAPAVPTLEQLEAFDYTQTGIVWPATGTVSAPDLPYFAANGVPTTILASTDLAGASTTTPRAPAVVDGQRVAVADARLSSALSRAVTATTDAAWRSAIDEVSAIVAVAASEGDTRPLLAALDRGWPATSFRLPDTLSTLEGLPWATQTGLGQVLGGSPSAVTVGDHSEGTTRVSTTRRLAASEQSLASFATAAVDPTVITGPERNSILGLLAIGWIDQADTWAGAVAAHETQTTATLNSITIVHSSDLLVLGSPAQIPVSVKNTLDTPVTVQVTAVPSNGRLIVDHSDPITVEAGSSSKVLIPVSAQIGSGKVALTITMTSLTGVTIGSPSIVLANVQADWEGLGAAILGTIVFVVFGVGIWRNVRRRRKARAAASTPDGIEADARNAPATEAATDAAEPANTAAPVDLAEHSDTDSDTDATPSDADERPVTPDSEDERG